MLLSNGKSESEGSEAVVIGSMVLDIHATPSIPSNPRTTTPGKVFVSLTLLPTNFYLNLFFILSVFFCVNLNRVSNIVFLFVSGKLRWLVFEIPLLLKNLK